MEADKQCNKKARKGEGWLKKVTIRFEDGVHERLRMISFKPVKALNVKNLKKKMKRKRAPQHLAVKAALFPSVHPKEDVFIIASCGGKSKPYSKNRHILEAYWIIMVITQGRYFICQKQNHGYG